MNPRVAELLQRGDVVMPHPESVFIDERIDTERIGAGATLHPGCRITGPSTSIGPGSEIGVEAPATVDACQLGHAVRLKGGFFQRSVFLDGASVGSAAHVRPGTLMEERSSAAHANGFKQTILFPFVTTGSLVNFCDGLVAGGTGPKHHSEIGSSFVHFNFTPHGDKATPSLIGDVPRGVFIDQAPIFLGGQGGVVGPVRVAYGTVLAAGSILRESVREENRLVLPGPVAESRSLPYAPGVYREVRSRVHNNLAYIGNLLALKAWYRHVRARFMESDPFRAACREGALQALDGILTERMKWLARLGECLSGSLEDAAVSGESAEEHRRGIALIEHRVAQGLAGEPSSAACASREELLGLIPARVDGAKYVETIQSLPPPARACGAGWLEQVAGAVAE